MLTDRDHEALIEAIHAGTEREWADAFVAAREATWRAPIEALAAEWDDVWRDAAWELRRALASTSVSAPERQGPTMSGTGWQQRAVPPTPSECGHLAAAFAAVSLSQHAEGHEWVCRCGQRFVVVSNGGNHKRLVKRAGPTPSAPAAALRAALGSVSAPGTEAGR